MKRQKLYLEKQEGCGDGEESSPSKGKAGGRHTVAPGQAASWAFSSRFTLFYNVFN